MSAGYAGVPTATTTNVSATNTAGVAATASAQPSAAIAIVRVRPVNSHNRPRSTRAATLPAIGEHAR